MDDRPCPFCDTLDAGARCPKCGRDPTARRHACARCHKMTPAADRQCCHCGAKSASSNTGLVIAVIVVVVIINVIYIIAVTS